ncbi:phage tail protein [Wohlfahrtiimonas chitiniclastica]|uniref:phage tail protein n=1 Tax=Wohlfahrtiimonas chitiniclastica TaxID=400946 RepID=UPI001BCF9E60|nr:phage tail protein [Wohlfahrtiimonas chitiniclastica]MBS7827391.1 phage tail protein [Wohlfahrtiimonas chitiniclastica]
MRKLIANGQQTIDAALYAASVPTSQFDQVIMMKENRHLAMLPAILPARTVIYLPEYKAPVKQTISLWD